MYGLHEYVNKTMAQFLQQNIAYTYIISLLISKNPETFLVRNINWTDFISAGTHYIGIINTENGSYFFFGKVVFTNLHVKIFVLNSLILKPFFGCSVIYFVLHCGRDFT